MSGRDPGTCAIAVDSHVCISMKLESGVGTSVWDVAIPRAGVTTVPDTHPGITAF